MRANSFYYIIKMLVRDLEDIWKKYGIITIEKILSQ